MTNLRHEQTRRITKPQLGKKVSFVQRVGCPDGHEFPKSGVDPQVQWIVRWLLTGVPNQPVRS